MGYQNLARRYLLPSLEEQGVKKQGRQSNEHAGLGRPTGGRSGKGIEKIYLGSLRKI